MAVTPGVGLQGMGEGIGDPGVAVTPQTLHTIGQGISSLVTLPSDPYWSSVVLLAVNDNKADTTTSFDDQSNSNHTLTAAGNAQYDTAQAPTGMTSSGLFDGTGDYVTAPANGDFTFGTGDLTIEMMVRLNSDGAFGVLSAGKSAPHNWLLLVRADINTLRFVANDAAVVLDQTWSPSTATWYHIAFVRSGNNWYHFVDGVQLGTTLTNSATIQTNNQTVAIGAFNDGANAYDGWISNLRVTKGVARYTANFTPPSLPLPTS